MICSTCNGEGVLEEVDRLFYPGEIREVICPDCHNGEIDDG